MTEAELAFLVTTPCDEFTSVSNQNQVSVLDSDQLLRFQCGLLVVNVDGQLKLNLSNLARILDNNFVACANVFGALAIVVPAPSKSFTFTVAS